MSGEMGRGMDEWLDGKADEGGNDRSVDGWIHGWIEG